MQLEQFRNAPNSGFSFINCRRNAELIRNGFQPPKTVKTGTTIAAAVFKGGVVLGADTRATEEGFVSDKNCVKIHYLAKKIYCCGAGTGADTAFMTRSLASDLELHRLNTNRQLRVICASVLLKQWLFRFKGFLNVCMLVGGVDQTGSYIYAIHPHGSSDKLPFSTMGTGCMAALSVFEKQWQEDLCEEDVKKLVRDSIVAGVQNDTSSGSNIDMCIIRKDSVDYLRNMEVPNKKNKFQLDYSVRVGTTPVLSTLVQKFDISEQVFPIVSRDF